MENENALAVQSGQVPAMVGQTTEIDIFDTDKMKQALAFAATISKSSLIPAHFRGKPEDCFIALYRAHRLGCDPFGYMEQTFIVKGKLGIQAQAVLGILNASGRYNGPIMFEMEGSIKEEKRCRAYAILRANGEKAVGPWVSYEMATAEGWNDPEPVYNYEHGNRTKVGERPSKWDTLTDLMLQYRSATFFGRMYASDLLLGLRTREELQDMREGEVYERKSLFPAEPQATVKEEISVAEETKSDPIQSELIDILSEIKTTKQRISEAEIKGEEKKSDNPEPPKEEPTQATPPEPEQKTPVKKMRSEIAAVFQDTPTDFDMYCRAKKWCGSAECFMDVPDTVIEKVYTDLPKVKNAFLKWVEKAKEGKK